MDPFLEYERKLNVTTFCLVVGFLVLFIGGPMLALSLILHEDKQASEADTHTAMITEINRPSDATSEIVLDDGESFRLTGDRERNLGLTPGDHITYRLDDDGHVYDRSIDSVLGDVVTDDYNSYTAVVSSVNVQEGVVTLDNGDDIDADVFTELPDVGDVMAYMKSGSDYKGISIIGNIN